MDSEALWHVEKGIHIKAVLGNVANAPSQDLHVLQNKMIREATAADAQKIAEIHIETWREAYSGIVPNDYLESLSIKKRASRWQESLEKNKKWTLVFEDEGSITGWISYGHCRDEGEEDKGEIYAVYVFPNCWRRGFGNRLMVRAEEDLFGEKLEEISLWVLEKNLPSRNFYERLGYFPDGIEKEIEIGGAKLQELRYLKRKAEQAGAYNSE